MGGSCAGVARGHLSDSEAGVHVYLRASPGAKRSEVKGLYGEHAIKLSVASPPEKGRANAEIEGLLAEVFGVGVSAVAVVRGAPGRDKVALVRSVSLEQALDSLDGELDGLGEYGG